jgi:ABC-2 type transport system permease protein/lipopolysaccharide transport system permease protein
MSSELLTEPAVGELPPQDRVRRAGATEEPGADIWFRRRMTLRSQLRELWQFRELALTLAERDLRARYKQAVFGFGWAVLTPLMLMVAFSFIFTRFAKVNSHGIPYPLFVYMALIPWTFFNASINAGGTSLITNMSVINKVYCPRELFVFASILVAAVDAAISALMLAILFVATGTAPKLESVYVVVLFPTLLVFTLGASLGLAALLVYLRDLRHALPLVLQFALLATPVAYSLQAIAKSRGFLLAYSAINPLAPVIDGFRRTVLLGRPPDWQALGIAAAVSVLVLIGSYRLFKRLETGFADIA